MKTERVLEKATTSLRARAQRNPPDFAQISDESDGFELIVPVTVTDYSGTEVAHADITTWVTPAQGVIKRRKTPHQAACRWHPLIHKMTPT